MQKAMKTAAQITQQAKTVKKLEDTIKLLARIRKDMLKLIKADYYSYKVITNKFDDDLHYDIDDQIKTLQNTIRRITEEGE